MSVLISPAALTARIDRGDAPRLLDVRWSLARPDGKTDYLDGHIPGAVYVDLDTELAGHGAPQDGRHPLPDIQDLQAAARRWGLNPGDSVVVYDDGPSLAAARAWWLLRWAGLSDVNILNGGYRGWLAAGGRVSTADESPAAGSVTLSPGHLPVIDIDEAAAWPGSGVLLDARAGDRYRGETEPVDPVAGHIPGAVSAPTTANVDATGRFLSPAALAARFADLGVAPGARIAVYCGSGVTAAHQIAALAEAGIDAALFPGSWSAWSNHPDRPVAVGAEPGTPQGAHLP